MKSIRFCWKVNQNKHVGKISIARKSIKQLLFYEKKKLLINHAKILNKSTGQNNFK